MVLYQIQAQSLCMTLISEASLDKKPAHSDLPVAYNSILSYMGMVCQPFTMGMVCLLFKMGVVCLP